MSDEKGLKFGDISKAAGEIQKLKDQLGALNVEIGNIQQGNVSFAQGLLNVAVTAGSVCETFGGFKSMLDGVKKKFDSTMDGSIFKKFGDAVGEGALTVGDGLMEYKTHFDNMKDGIKELPGKVKGTFSSAGDHIKGFGKVAGDSFSNLKTSIKNFSFKDLASKVKELPEMFDSGIKGAGEKLYANAEKIGAKSGKLLSVGMSAGVAVAAAAILVLVTAFSYLMESNAAFKEKVTEAWGKVKEAFQPAIDAFNEFKDVLFGASEDDGFTPFVELILDGVMSIIDLIAGAVETISDIVTSIFEFLTEAWQENGEGLIDTIKEKWSSIWDSIFSVVQSVWSLITTVIGAAIDFIKSIWAVCGDEIMAVVGAIWDFTAGIVEGASTFISGIIDFIVGIFTLNGDKIKEGLGKMWEGIKGIFGAGLEFVGSIFSLMWEKICEIFGGVKEWFHEKFTGAWNAVKKVFSGVGSFFGGIWNTIVGKFKDIGVKVGNAVGGAFKGAVNAVIKFAQNIINGFIGGINKVIKVINKIPGVSISVIPKASLPKLADGGVLEAGQMFIARERGPELVGSFSGRTAVMNNNQIVDSVSRGVYAAVRDAVGDGDSGCYTFNIMNHLDGREIGKQVIKYHNGVVKQTGVSPLYV